VEGGDTVLDGRNVVFSESWLNHVGEGRNQITQEQFRQFVERSDKFYDALVHLTGRLPYDGQRILVDLTRDMPRGMGAYVQRGTPRIAHNQRTINEIVSSIQAGSWVFPQIHEMTHIFEGTMNIGGSRQNTDLKAESMANFMKVFAMQLTGATFTRGEHFFTMSAPLRNPVNLETVNHRQWSQTIINRTARNFENDNLETFGATSESTDSAFDKYLHNLVRYVGWQPVMLAFRSYQHGVLQQLLRDGTLRELSPHGAARDFLERIEVFSWQPGILQQVSDGLVLNEHFNWQDPRLMRGRAVDLPQTFLESDYFEKMLDANSQRGL